MTRATETIARHSIRDRHLALNIIALNDFPSIKKQYQIGTQRRYSLAFVHAPVFDERQAVAFTLGLMGFTDLFPGGQVERMGRSLREACDRITRFAGLRMPA